MYGSFFPGKPFVNRGISSQKNLAYARSLFLRCDCIRPLAVVILGGTNDLYDFPSGKALQDIESNLAAMAQLAQTNGIRVVLASVLPVCDCFTAQTQHRSPAKIMALNSWIKRYCEQNGLVYLNYYSAMADPAGLFKKGLTYDGLHPNAAGYQVMTPLTMRAIEQAVAKP